MRLDHPDDYYDPADDDVPPLADRIVITIGRDPLHDYERPGTDTHTDNLRGGY